MLFSANGRRSLRIQGGLICSVFAGLSGLLVGCGAQTSAAGGGGGNPAPPVAAAVAFCDDGVAGCPAASAFSVETARDIVIQISWANVPEGNHVQTLALSLPGGGLYQQTETAFAIDAGAPGTITLRRTLPVAATWIQQRSITGQWTVQAALDGQPVTSQTMELNP